MKLVVKLLLASTALVVHGERARAADFEARSTIGAVTVYPDGATVTRVLDFDLPPGPSTLILRGLPSSVDPASIRVTGGTGTSLSILGVDLRFVPGEARPTIDPELDAAIEKLDAQRKALAGAIEAAEVKKASIQRFAEARPDKLGADAAPLAVEKWQAAWDAVGDGLVRVNATLADLTMQVRRIEAEIATLENARPRPAKAGAPLRDLSIVVDAQSQSVGTLQVHYRVSQASWQPIYDVRLDTGTKVRKPSIELVRRARIAQTTGEDWSDVSLALSTVRATRGTAAPDLATLLVSFADPVRGQTANSPAAQVSQLLADEQRSKAERKAGAAPAREQEAQVDAGAFQASFVVPTRTNVPRDGTSKTVLLSSRTISPSLIVKTAPAIDDTAYLEATFLHEEEVVLLPGEASLIRDDIHVGRGRLGLTAIGESVELGFGPDDRVRVKRVPLKKELGETGWIGTSKSDLRDVKTTVKNLHETPIRVVVLDRLPVSEDQAITVETLPQTTPPSEKAVLDRRGILAWNLDLVAGEQKDVRLTYRVKWPADRSIMTRSTGTQSSLR